MLPSATISEGSVQWLAFLKVFIGESFKTSNTSRTNLKLSRDHPKNLLRVALKYNKRRVDRRFRRVCIRMVNKLFLLGTHQQIESLDSFLVHFQILGTFLFKIYFL